MTAYRQNALRPCPRCGDGLILESAELGVHTCTQCGGAWLAAKTIPRLAAARVPVRNWLWWRRATGRCPDCELELRLVQAGPLLLDECADHGVWFDAGELHRVLADVGDDVALDAEALLARLRAVLSRTIDG